MANPPPCGDLLSDLPVSLIESILVFLPIKDAIRTSILSSNWRFIWTTLPHLDFIYQSYYMRNEESDARFRTFVTRTLLRHEGPVHKFRLATTIESCTDTDQWLLFLVRKDIKELILDMDARFDVPSCLYLFQGLTFLELDNCVFSPPPPNFKGFTCLRTLIFRHLSVPLSTIQSVVAHSPLLESLECTGYISHSEMIISAPNLKCLKLNDGFVVPSCLYLFQILTYLELSHCEFTPPPPNFEGFPCLRTFIIRHLDIPIRTFQSIVEQSPLLESMELELAGYLYSYPTLIIRAPNLKYLNLKFDCLDVYSVYFYAPLLARLSLSMDFENDVYESPEKATFCYYTKFLGCFANIDTLIGDGPLTEYFTCGIEHYQHPLVFHRLKTITLGKVNFKSMDEILVAVHLIVDASATLCDLQLSSCDYGEEDIVSTHFWDSICPQNCTFGKLKSVRVEDFGGYIQEMNFVKFLLARSPVLEMLKIKPGYIYPTSRVLNLKAKLSSYPRASSSANILFEV